MKSAIPYRKHIALLALTAMMSICAAGQSSSQVSIFGTFGVLSGMVYTPATGDNQMKFGYGGGFNYTYFFKPTFGLTIGGEVLTFTNQYDMPEFPIGDDPANDGEEDFRLRYKLTNYSEQQNLMSLLIPVMLTFETKGRKAKFFASAGAKINIILSATYSGTAQGIETKGYYPQYGLTLGEQKPMLWMGFGGWSNISGKGKLPLNSISPVISAEMGAKIALSRDWFLYIGGYFDYGLGLFNKPDKSSAFVKYNSDAILNSNARGSDFLTMNSVINSQYGGEKLDKVFVDNLSLMSAGVKLKVAFNSEIIMHSSAPKSMDVSLFGDNEKPAPPAPAPAPLTNEAPPTEVKEQVKTGEEENVNVVLKQRITFTIKNSTLSTKQKTDLDRKVKILEKKPNLKLIVRGNANDFFDKKTEKDSKLKKAAEAQNKKLSAARAKAVKDYMVSKGISTSRIKVVARGSKSRLVPDTTPRNRAKNRRVDFVIVGEK